MGQTRVVSVGGNFVASNATPIVDLLSAPAKLRANKLLSVVFTGLDSQNNNDRLTLALNMGKFDVGDVVETAGHRTVNITDPLASADFLNVFAHGSVTGGTASGGPVGNTVVVPLHGLEVVEQIDLLCFFPDNTTDLQWFVDLFYEQIKMSQRDWTTLRHRSPVEHRTFGTVTI